jgi:hypothetical protein
MKKYFLGAFVALVVAGAAMFNASLNNSQNGMSVIALVNIEVLAGENPMDSRVWYVNASSSTSWTCEKDGTSACPAP